MMYPRLQLLWQMLSEDGSLWMSIDDNEVHNARAILDEIFGPQNFISTIIWEKSYAAKSSAKHLSDRHEYIILYAKTKSKWGRNLLPRTEGQDRLYKNPDNDPRGRWRPNNLAARNYYSKGTYSITTPGGRFISGPPKGSYWRIAEDRLWELHDEGRIWWGEDGNNVPAPKIYLTEVKQGLVPETIWFFRDVGHSQEGKKEIIKILPNAEIVFTTPKPTRLIQRILQISTGPNDLVLDSFAGSGTTGQAVLRQNLEDGGSRRFILVELEQNIASEVTAERLSQIIRDYEFSDKKGNRNKEPGLGGGFRYCELGTALFDADGQINAGVKYDDLARHVFFIETGQPLPHNAKKHYPLLGRHDETAVYLLYNGVLKDRSANGGNVLTRAVLRSLPEHEGPRVIYGNGCLLSVGKLQELGITFRQIPYEVKAN